jgi:8-amino-7-oxononanoate synthase
MKFPLELSEKIANRAKEGSLRSLVPVKSGIDFYSNDYLGFARSEALQEAIHKLELEEPCLLGSTGSRLISGNTKAHESLEHDLAAYFNAPSALLFNSGYDANIGLLSAILQRKDKIFYDQLSHASIRDGIQLSRAKAFGFKHNDLDDLRKKIRNTESAQGQVYVIVESIYSMDGDQAPLKELAELCQEENILLIVDEAHATGVKGPGGRGLTAALQIEDKVFARLHTFGKALGCHGAAVLGSEELKTYLVNFARSFIYTTAIPPMEAQKVSQALKLLATSDQMDKLNRNVRIFNQEVEKLELAHCFLESTSPIQSFLLKYAKDRSKLEQKLEREGFAVKFIMAPTVPKGEERFRICLHSYNTSEQIRKILYLLSTFV